MLIQKCMPCKYESLNRIVALIQHKLHTISWAVVGKDSLININIQIALGIHGDSVPGNPTDAEKIG